MTIAVATPSSVPLPRRESASTDLAGMLTRSETDLGQLLTRVIAQELGQQCPDARVREFTDLAERFLKKWETRVAQSQLEWRMGNAGAVILSFALASTGSVVAWALGTAWSLPVLSEPLGTVVGFVVVTLVTVPIVVWHRMRTHRTMVLQLEQWRTTELDLLRRVLRSALRVGDERSSSNASDRGAGSNDRDARPGGVANAGNAP